MSFYWKQAWLDSTRNKCNYCLGFCSIFIVVISILLVNTLVNQGPIIFITISQGIKGQIDAQAAPASNPQLYKDEDRNHTKGAFFNYT